MERCWHLEDRQDGRFYCAVQQVKTHIDLAVCRGWNGLKGNYRQLQTTYWAGLVLGYCEDEEFVRKVRDAEELAVRGILQPCEAIDHLGVATLFRFAVMGLKYLPWLPEKLFEVVGLKERLKEFDAERVGRCTPWLFDLIEERHPLAVEFVNKYLPKGWDS